MRVLLVVPQPRLFHRRACLRAAAAWRTLREHGHEPCISADQLIPDGLVVMPGWRRDPVTRSRVHIWQQSGFPVWHWPDYPEKGEQP